MSSNLVCPVCTSSEVSVFFEIFEVPVHIGVLLPDRDAARNCPKGDIQLSFCKNCGFISNIAFDPSHLEYTQAYDNSLHFSPLYAQYAHSTALRLIERYELYNKNIIEIGCGKGDFLLLLCELGNNCGVGFDSSYATRDIDNETATRVSFIQDMYSERYASYQGDLICSRYVFEHVQNPIEFLNMIRYNMGDRANTVVYFEVPNVYLILRSLSIWDIIYEHCSYFSPLSLANVFESCGFDILELNETFGHQFLAIEASPIKNGNASWLNQLDDINRISSDVNIFFKNYQNKMQTWRYHLKNIEKAGKRAVVWGAGARGVSFLNMLKIRKQIEYLVDINPNKNGKYIAGTGQKIVSPEFLRDYEPNVIILMNPMYKNEIRQRVKNLGLATEFLSA